jgi:hypothetical protein
MTAAIPMIKATRSTDDIVPAALLVDIQVLVRLEVSTTLYGKAARRA